LKYEYIFGAFWPQIDLIFEDYVLGPFDLMLSTSMNGTKGPIYVKMDLVVSFPYEHVLGLLAQLPIYNGAKGPINAKMK